VKPYTKAFTVATVLNDSGAMTGGFSGSATTCLDWAIDEMSISGVHTIAIYVDQSHFHVPATPLPAIQSTGIQANTG
jgi:hypothetical protein